MISMSTMLTMVSWSKIYRRTRPLLVVCLLGAAVLASGADPRNVHVNDTSVGPRPLEEQTKSSVVRDYLEAWRTLGSALGQNRTDLLDRSFVGFASERLADTIQQQRETGVQTVYRDLSHHIDLVFYSPEGMSIQLIDNVEYEIQIVDRGHLQGTERVHSRYVSILTPTEVRWKVRVLQAAPQ